MILQNYEKMIYVPKDCSDSLLLYAVYNGI